MADPKIPLADLPYGLPGAFDRVAGVDTATGDAKQFPMPQAGEPKDYQTVADLPGPAGLQDGTPAYVTNDPIATNNGRWSVFGGMWTQAGDRVTGLEGRVSTVEDDVADIRSLIKRDETVGITPLEYLVSGEPDCFGYSALMPEGASIFNSDIGEPESFDSYFPGVMRSAKMVVAADGRLAWQDHNLLPQSETFGVIMWTKSGVSVAAAPDGTLLQNTNTSAFVRNGAPAGQAGRAHTLHALIRVVVGSWFRLAFNDGSDNNAWFNLATGVVGQVASGVEAKVSSLMPDGSPVPAGFRHVAITFRPAINNFQVLFAVVSGDGSTATNIGDRYVIARACVNYGIAPVNYIATEGVPLYGLSYDYSKGQRTLLLEGGGTYNSKWGDDLTRAEWVKTNCTAAFDATIGPHNEPASVLTATSANATCLQTIASGVNTQYFSVYLRRRSGSGGVEITADGGATWEPVDIGPEYRRFAAYKGGSNPVVGVRLTTSGDQVDVSLAINSATPAVLSPIPMYSANVIRSSDEMEVPLSLLPSGSEGSLFVDHWTEEFEPHGSILAPAAIGLYGAGNNYIRMTSSPGGRTFNTQEPSGSTNAAIYLHEPGERLQEAFRWRQGDYACSINGDPTLWMPSERDPEVDRVTVFRVASPMYLSRLLVTRRYVSDDELRTWRYVGQGGVIVADSTAIREQAVPEARGAREPMVSVIADDGRRVTLAVGASQRGAVQNGTHVEQPNRFVLRRYSYDRLERKLTPIDPAPRLIYQPPGWAVGDGGGNGPTFIKVKSGKHKGRLLFVFSRNDNPEGDAGGVNRILNLYCMHSEDNGDTWNEPVLIAPGADFDGKIIVTGSNGSFVQFPPDHPDYAHRIVIPLWSFNTRQHLIRTDDGGDTWTVGAALTGMPAEVTRTSENNVALRPDGKLMLTTRVDNITPEFDGERLLSISHDGGETIQYVKTLKNFILANAGMTSLDVAGNYGSKGRIAISHPWWGEPVNARRRMRIRTTTDGFETFDSITRFGNDTRYLGYSSLARIDDDLVAMAYETGTIPFNVDNSTHVAIVQLPPA